MKYSKPFSSLNKTSAVIAGGKGASLGEMLNAGIPVPDGFVVLSTTFDDFIEKAGLSEEISAALDAVDHKTVHTIDAASERIQELIKHADMPEDIASEIFSQFDVLDTPYVAVRSSATAEDGADHAWAGQLDSYLNTTRDNVLKKVQDCWASLFTPRAIFYRFEKGLHTTKISVAVVVQKMVNSEISGIAFSVHPVTEDHNQLIIEAGLGLGEAIVSGSVTPDSYVVEKEPRHILDISVNHQNKALYRKEGGGNDWIELSDGKADQQVLTEDQINELSNIILTIESHYGFPCDIEWAFEQGKFYIVQSRPITTLNSNNPQPEEHGNLFSKNKVPVITEPMLYRGKRSPGIFEAIDKVKSWTTAWQKEIGIHYHIAVINSDGENWVDSASNKEVGDFFDTKDFTVAKEYIQKMDTLRQTLLLEIKKHPTKEYRDAFSELLGYFFIIRQIIERTFNTASEEDKKIIEDWRNNEELFTPMDIYYRMYPQPVIKGEWSVVYQDGAVECYPVKITFPKPSIDSDEIKGISAYKGRATGSVRIIDSYAKSLTILDGEILVASMTFPSYLPAMKRAAAIVTDEGGITSHVAINARELKKPSVINTRVATQVLKDGDMIEVDADSGIVRIIKKA